MTASGLAAPAAVPLTNAAKAEISRGYSLMRMPASNRGLGFRQDERAKLGLRGLLPPAYLNLDAQAALAMEQLRKKSTDIEKYIFLQSLQDSNETLYYALLVRYTDECMPIAYTPVVGEACQTFSHIYRQTPRGLYISMEDRGSVRELLDNWPVKDVKAIVFTDGECLVRCPPFSAHEITEEPTPLVTRYVPFCILPSGERILGLGDQGIDGMGIPVGKLALYTACGGVPPHQCLPVVLDVGTNNETKLKDPFYMGLRQKRVTGPEYHEFVAEFIEACQDAYGRNVMLQFEDFGNHNAFQLLQTWQDRACTFNDGE
jgi:malate dehydrogenase (oxaloacetate-decarboxylating)(NADP+)